MTPMMKKGLIVAVVHVAIVSSLGAKLLVDRATRPRVWARAAPVDPSLPIRGRYVSLRLEVVPAGGFVLPEDQRITNPNGSFYLVPAPAKQVKLVAQGDALVAVPGDDWDDVRVIRRMRDGSGVVVLESPVAYFIPDGVRDPSIRAPGEELWVEVTIPRAGLPRPIRLGVKKDGVITPLDVR